MNSYHIFYFPFKWENIDRKNRLFSEQTDLSAISVNKHTNWLRNPGAINEVEESQLYNEKNFYYEFVHPVLYDNNQKNSIVHHYERKEPQQRDVSYCICVKGKTYRLKVDAINLNLYATGVGMLTFFLKNEQENQQEPSDILTINQYGRRVFPPFYGDIEGKFETADSLQVEGLNGEPTLYKEDFSTYKVHKKTWKPACFILNLIADLSEHLLVLPVIDERMFVNCWYASDKLTNFFTKNDKSLDQFFLDDNETNDFWYKYVYVDASSPSCKNEEMRQSLLTKQTYTRWQNDGMLYGASRYSFVLLTKTNEFQTDVIAIYMRTVYSRMVEHILVQRASRLRFSDEVARVSTLPKGRKLNKVLIEQISSLYKEYIRFINQVHFLEVTSQDQGIELYELLYRTLSVEKHVKELEIEIAELNQYVNLLDDKIRNKNAEILNYIAATFLPASIVFGLFSANAGNWDISLVWIGLIGLTFSVIMFLIVFFTKNK